MGVQEMSRDMKLLHPVLVELHDKSVSSSPEPFFLTCTHRPEKEQNSAFMTGHSKLRWPNSKHNKLPSEAFDVADKNCTWEVQRFVRIADHIKKVWKEEVAEKYPDLDLVWGGDWKMRDYPHFQIQKKAAK
jgi:hypothetical protein